MDNAVTRTQRHTATVHDEVRQGVVGLHIHRLGISGGVTEGLHHQLGREAQTGQILQLITGHGASGILGADCGHLGLTVGARTNAGHATGLAHHLLGQGVTLAGISHRLGTLEDIGEGQTQRFTRLVGETTTHDQRNTATSTHLIQQHIGLEFEGGDHLIAAMTGHLARIDVDVDDIAGIHLADIQLDGQGTGIFHGVEEDGSNLATQHETTRALVGHVRNIVAHKPEHGVGGRLTG